MAILAAMLTLSLFACASTKNGKRVEIERLLMAAGFKKGVADTPEKLAQLKKLPQRKIARHEQGDNILYIYADVENCKCAYAGHEEAYKKYQKLALAKQLVEEDQRDAVRDRQRQMDWGDWRFNRSW